MKIKPTFFSKQRIVLKLLMDFTNGISEVLFGGAAGGGKSRIGCSWILTMAIMFPSTRYLIGRAKLLALKQTTLNTMYEVFSDWGMKEGEHWKMNGQTNTITLENGSEIILKDLFLYPSDPEFDSLGSLEITAAFIDEVPQVTEKAKNIVMSRIRYKLGDFCGHCGRENKHNIVLKYDSNLQPIKWRCTGKSCGKATEGITPKLLMTCNPSRGWLYRVFYKLWKEGRLEHYKAFIQSFVTDNKYISRHYITNLGKLDEVSRARLRDGLWEYSDKLTMFNYDEMVVAMATKREVTGTKYFMSIDVARLGKDSTTVFVISSSLEVVYIEEWGQTKIPETIKRIQVIKDKYEIDEYDMAIDSDGVGGGVADHFDNAVAIVNNSKALDGANFANLKTQLYFKLAEKLNAKEIAFNAITDEQADRLQSELQVIKRDKVDQDGKVSMTPKKEIKQALGGNSPDYADTFAYAMVFFLEDEDDSYMAF